MKTVKLLALLVVAGALVFSGCKKDDEPADVPTISVSLKTGYDLTAWKGDTIKWSVTMGTNEKLATLKVEPNVGNTGTNVVNQTLSGTSQVVDYSYIVPTAGINDGDQIVITFTVTNDKDGTNNVKQTLTMDAPATANPINTYSNVTLVSAYLAATAGNQFLDATTGIAYRHDATGSANATFGFISGGGSGADIVCSGSTLSFIQKPTGWATGAKLATTSITAAQFDAITNETELLAVMPSTIAANDVQGLNTTYYAVLAFDDGGKKGFIKLPASFTNAQDQSIVVSVKVQQ
jgi:hypothetical protein